jgi:anti-anti-sigma factor
MQLTTRQAGDFLIIGFEKPIQVDFFNADAFSRALGEQSEEHPNLAIDCSNLTGLSSKALGALILLYDGIQSRNGQLRFFNLGETLHGVFKTTRLDTIFDIYPDEEAALAESA